MKTETKHTEGPWHNGNDGYIVRNSVNDPVANCHYTEAQSLIFQEQQLANARLIAAAPDMLEALVNARDTLLSIFAAVHAGKITLLNNKQLVETKQVIDNARKVISKAEGYDEN